VSEQLSFFDSDFLPPPVERVFLPWDKPLLDRSIDFLTENWENGPLDLSDTLIIVPTRVSGRRLREQLAIAAANKNSGVIAPQVITEEALRSPEFFLNKNEQVPTNEEAIVAWTYVLQTTNIENYPTLFPVPPIRRDFDWALGLANEYNSLQILLAEADLTFSDVSKRVKDQDMEPERWTELSKLEFRWTKELGKLKKVNPVTTRTTSDLQTQLKPSIKHIVLLGTFDLSPSAKNLLQKIGKHTKCTTAIYAPEEFSDHFDAWGTPLQYWSEQNILIPQPEQTIHRVDSPSAQSSQVIKLLSKERNDSIALGILDEEVTRSLQPDLNNIGISSFDPSGIPYAKHSLVYALRTLHRFKQTHSVKDLLELLRLPGHPAELIIALEDFSRKHLCYNLGQLKEFSTRPEYFHKEISEVLKWSDQLLSTFDQKSETVISRIINLLYPDKNYTSVFSDGVETLSQTLDSLSSVLRKFKFNTDEELTLLLHLFSQQKHYDHPQSDELLLQGWLELLWENSEHLIIAGFNEHKIPERIQSHSFLPDTLRRFLGLKNNSTKHARDAYLLQALLASHQSINFIFSRTNIDRDPLRPSPLLLACKTEELPARVRQLFEETGTSNQPEAWSAGWKITPPAPPEHAKVFTQLSVTQFSAYLSCPFRFYLKHVLKMEELESNTKEMNARNFGNIFHQVLENFGNSELKESTNSKEINQYFRMELEKQLFIYFGETKSVPLKIQRESLLQRLTWWSAIEAEQRIHGWEISEVEKEIHKTPWDINGTLIRGKIDRIEIHRDTGAMRLIDFKTGKVKSVADAHIENVKKGLEFPEWMIAPDSRKLKRWTNLQLPLYHLAIQRLFPDREISTAYVTLGETKENVKLMEWPQFNNNLLDSAYTCTCGVIDSIKKKTFWPATPDPKYDDFGSLLFGNPEKTVNPVNLITHP